MSSCGRGMGGDCGINWCVVEGRALMERILRGGAGAECRGGRGGERCEILFDLRQGEARRGRPPEGPEGTKAPNQGQPSSSEWDWLHAWGKGQGGPTVAEPQL